ncbi:hypothetical protein CCAX7_36180 [Capsulimonas corticalis]|uniref:Anti-sigma factor antagonist n=1 Tax=Capsulimonas corticalis TaxID=2219043 RepID=A0A402D6X9_9BACT|nr:STAS domain-containing protein [Capsulimonas corticalis]BDI31567.1 hypothetical protein CCAX7_36180 [Capsulimonas corticalis]
MTINTLAPNRFTRIFEIDGDLDLTTSPDLKVEIDRLLGAGVKNLIINLSLVKYLDSSSLGVLVSSLKRMQEMNGNLILVSPTPSVLRILELTSLTRIFEVFATNTEAISKTALVYDFSQ